MIPQAVHPISTAKNWSALKATGFTAGSDTGESLFQSLFEGLAAATPGTAAQSDVAPVSSTTGSIATGPGTKMQNGDARKAINASDMSQADAIVPQQQATVPMPDPLPWLLNSMTMPANFADGASGASNTQLTFPSSQVQSVMDEGGNAVSRGDVPLLASASSANGKMLALFNAAPSFALGEATSSSTGGGLTLPGSAAEMVQPAATAAHSPEAIVQGSSDHQGVGSASGPSAAPVSTSMQTAFSLLLRPEADAAPQRSGSLSIPATEISFQDSGQQRETGTPMASDAKARSVPANGAAAPAGDLANVNARDNVSSAISSPSINSEVSAATPPGSGTAISIAPVNKPEAANSNANGKGNQEPADDRQSLITAIDTSAATPLPSKSENTATAAPSNERPATEYVAAQPTDTNTQANRSVTDIRLQVEGAANQRVNVRVIQEGDGVRVTVRSNDGNLTQSLQDRLPDLTTRLEQHHYQADVAVPPRSAPPSGDTGSGTNPEQQSSGRQQSSGGQGNPQNRQNKQQEQTPEEQVFASLLGIRR